jgi:hypothetical protein
MSRAQEGNHFEEFKKRPNSKSRKENIQTLRYLNVFKESFCFEEDVAVVKGEYTKAIDLGWRGDLYHWIYV